MHVPYLPRSSGGAQVASASSSDNIPADGTSTAEHIENKDVRVITDQSEIVTIMVISKHT